MRMCLPWKPFSNQGAENKDRTAASDSFMITSRFHYARPPRWTNTKRTGSHHRRKRIRVLPLAKNDLVTGIIVPFPQVRPAGRNTSFDIAEFILVLVLAGSALAGTMIMLSCSIY